MLTCPDLFKLEYYQGYLLHHNICLSLFSFGDVKKKKDFVFF